VASCLVFFVLLSFEAVRSTKVRALILWLLHLLDVGWHDVARRCFFCGSDNSHPFPPYCGLPPQFALLQDVARDVEVDGIEKVLLERSRAATTTRLRTRSKPLSGPQPEALPARQGPRNSTARTRRVLARSRAKSSAGAAASAGGPGSPHVLVSIGMAPRTSQADVPVLSTRAESLGAARVVSTSAVATWGQARGAAASARSSRGSLRVEVAQFGPPSLASHSASFGEDICATGADTASAAPMSFQAPLTGPKYAVLGMPALQADVGHPLPVESAPTAPRQRAPQALHDEHASAGGGESSGGSGRSLVGSRIVSQVTTSSSPGPASDFADGPVSPPARRHPPPNSTPAAAASGAAATPGSQEERKARVLALSRRGGAGSAGPL
jgi:hypothetical protein